MALEATFSLKDSVAACGNCGASLSPGPPRARIPAKERLSREERWAKALSSSSGPESADDARARSVSQYASPAGNAELVRIADATERTATATERIFLLMVVSTIVAGLAGLVAAVLLT